MTQGRVILLIIIAAVVGIFFTFDLGQYLTLDYIKSQQAHLDAEVAARPLAIAAAYFLVYVLVTAISLPGAAIMTLAGGAMFGLWWGLLLVSFASTIGATLAMLVARFVLREQVSRRFERQLSKNRQGY